MTMASSPLHANREAVLSAFERQVGWCSSLGSPFTAKVLSQLRDDLAQGGRTADLLGSWPGDPLADALPLRLAAALHALVLTDAAPDLAACYPPPHSDTPDHLWPILNEVLTRHDDMIRQFLVSPPQTNEVGRSGVLLGGFLTVAASTGLPLRVLEIGASAGLNLNFDRYRYRLGSSSWGDPDSPVVLAPDWTGASCLFRSRSASRNAPPATGHRSISQIRRNAFGSEPMSGPIRRSGWSGSTPPLHWPAATGSSSSGPMRPAGCRNSWPSRRKVGRPSSFTPSCGPMSRHPTRPGSLPPSRPPAGGRPTPPPSPGCGSSRRALRPDRNSG